MQGYDSHMQSTQGLQPISYTRLIELQLQQQKQLVVRTLPDQESSEAHNGLQVCTGLGSARGDNAYCADGEIKRQLALHLGIPLEVHADYQQTVSTKCNRLEIGESCYEGRQSSINQREISQKNRHQFKNRQTSLPLANKTRQTALKSIQENELEYKKSDDSQRSIIDNKIFRKNLQSLDQVNPSKRTAQSHQLFAKRSQTLNPSMFEKPCFRKIDDSFQIEEQNEELRVEQGQSRQADRLTLRLVPEVTKKSALLSQSPEGRGILSSLVTSKRQQGPPGQEKQKAVGAGQQKSVLQLIVTKIQSLERLIAQVKQRKRQTYSQRVKQGKIQREIKKWSQEYKRFGNYRDIVIQDSEISPPLRIVDMSLLEQVLKSPMWKQSQLSWKTSEQAVRFMSQILKVLAIRVDSIRNVQFLHKELVTQLLPTHYRVTLRPDYIYIRLSTDSQDYLAKEVGIEVRPMQYAYSGSFIVKNKQSHAIKLIRQGYGSIVYLNSYYQGCWHSGNYHGRGVFHDSNGNLYEGIFCRGLKEGYGRQLFANGDQYSGCFSNNLYEGRGKYKWGSGSMYVGEFHEGLMHGKGVWKSGSDDYYKGEFRKGLKEGWGVYIWKNGCAFRGYFKKGKMTTHHPSQLTSFEYRGKQCDKYVQEFEEMNEIYQNHTWKNT